MSRHLAVDNSGVVLTDVGKVSTDKVLRILLYDMTHAAPEQVWSFVKGAGRFALGSGCHLLLLTLFL